MLPYAWQYHKDRRHKPPRHHDGVINHDHLRHGGGGYVIHFHFMLLIHATWRSQQGYWIVQQGYFGAK